MAIIDIHGKKVHVDDDSSSARHAAEYLSDLESSEADNFFQTARNNKFTHFETPRRESNKTLHHDMTLEHSSDGTFHLRKRTSH